MDAKQRILIIRIDFLGDMVCTTPLLHALKTSWPQSEIHVVANKYNAPILDNNPAVSKVHYYVYSKNRHKNIRPGFFNYIKERLSLILSLRKLKFDLLIIPNGGMCKNAISFARQLKVPDCRWHNAATEFDDRVKAHVATRPLIHEALAGFMLIPELGMPDIERLKLHIFPCPEKVDFWQKKLGAKKKLRVGFFVSNNSVQRQWPTEKWLKLSDALGDSYEIVVFHSPQENSSAVWREKKETREIFTPTVPDLIAAMTQLDIAISADSAPVHLASALQIPLVALFESRLEKYRRWHPLGVRAILLHEGKQVSDISVASVVTAVNKLLSEEKTSELQPFSVERSLACQ